MDHATQESELIEARFLVLGFNGVRLDRCRHESVDATTLWLFDDSARGNGSQIGCVKRLDGGQEYRATCEHEWEATRMLLGQPVARRCEKTLQAALRWVATYERRK